MNMRLRILGIVRKLGSPRDNPFKVSRFMRSPVSSHILKENQSNAGQVGSRASQFYIIASQRLQEIEHYKAIAISLSRHERWKAGGPL